MLFYTYFVVLVVLTHKPLIQLTLQISTLVGLLSVFVGLCRSSVNI